MIRHLVLPNNLSSAHDILRSVADEISPNVTLSLMNQYFPVHKALRMPELSRKITVQEYDVAVAQLSRLYLEQGCLQTKDYLVPFPKET